MRARWPASILFLFLTCLLVTGCKTHYNFYSDPVPLPQEEKPIDEPVRLALVLGAGGARGMAHVGVLEEFERAGISVDLIVGCSAGSLVGALYADNPSADYIKQLLYSLRRKDFLDYSLMQCRFGFVQGNHLRTLLKRTMDKEHFADLDIKLVITATDLISGELITLNGGEVAPAVHASCAVPFYFRPVQLYGRILVDGGVVDPIPVNIAQTYNPKIIIAVDLTKNLPDTFPRNLFGVAKRSLEILIHNQSRRSIEGADVVIQPQLPPMGLFDEGFEECLYESGRHAAKCAIPMIKEKLAQRSNHESDKSSIQESRVYPLKIYR